MAEKTVDEKTGGSRIIGRLLPTAVQLWLRSQVEGIEALSIDLLGRDRQIIRGYIPGATVAARNAVYRGICVSQVQLSAKDIRINIGQVVRGKPLKLLNGFPVSGEVSLSVEDLSNSLQSPLLQEGLNNFWQALLKRPDFVEELEGQYGKNAAHPDMTMHQPQIRLGCDRLALLFYPALRSEVSQRPVILGTGLAIANDHFLQLNEPQWLPSLEALDEVDEGLLVHALQNFRWNLGKDTQLSQLRLDTTQLLCRGQVMVVP